MGHPKQITAKIPSDLQGLEGIQQEEEMEEYHNGQRPGITDLALKKAGVRYVKEAEAYSLCGLKTSGLYIPYTNLNGTPLMDDKKTYGRLRLDKTQGDKKYHQRKGSGVHGYIPPGLNHLPPGRDLFLVEGEFKALALNEAGIPSVGLPGLYATSDGKLTPEVQAVIDHLRPTRIFYVGDADTVLNYQFADAVVKFARSLQWKIPIALPRIPLDGPGKGVDDCREKLGSSFNKWWADLISNAYFVPPKETVGNLCVYLLRQEIEKIRAIKSDQFDLVKKRLVAMAAALNSDPLYQDEVKEIAFNLDFKKRPFNKAINNYIGKQREKNSLDCNSKNG